MLRLNRALSPPVGGIPGLRIARVVLVLVLALGGSACGRPGGGEPPSELATEAPARRETGRPLPDLVLITVDTLRADHLGLYGYERPTSPHLDEYFAEGTVFRRAYSTHAMTGPSVVSFLTGMLPQRHGVRLLFQRLPKGVGTIADTLGRLGYQTAAVVSNMVLTAEAIGLDVRFDHYDDFVDESELYRDVFERRASRTTNAALVWLAERRDREMPTFLWVHYIDPHGPYHPPEDAPVDFTHEVRVPIERDRIPTYVRQPGNLDGADYVDRYDEEIAYVDREVGRLLAALPDFGMDAPTVLFTSDHGESMMDHDLWFRHGHDVYEEVVHVPLMIRGPSIGGEEVDTPVSIADIAPTIRDLAGVAPRASYGRSLFDIDPERPVFAEAAQEGGQVRAMWRGDQKWRVRVKWNRGLLASTSRTLLRTFFFTRPIVTERNHHVLTSDSRERHPRRWKDDPRARPLLRLIADDPIPAGKPLARGDRAGERIQDPKLRPGLDDRTLERLRALGYVQ